MTTDLFQMEKLTRAEREQVFFFIVSKLGRPASFLELGCGDGWLVRAAKQLMARPSIGIGSDADRQIGHRWATILVRDISRPFNLEGSFQLVLALGERPHPANAFAFVQPGGRLVTAHHYVPDSRFEASTLDVSDSISLKVFTHANRYFS